VKDQWANAGAVEDQGRINGGVGLAEEQWTSIGGPLS
jgi:hypothetical protein